MPSPKGKGKFDGKIFEILTVFCIYNIAILELGELLEWLNIVNELPFQVVVHRLFPIEIL